MQNRNIYLKDPLQTTLLNDGVVSVQDEFTEDALKTLRYELETFVCEGQYSDGLERMLASYLKNLDKPKQPAAWVSGFFGSGKSHLVKMLRFLWTDFGFSDGAKARGIAKLSEEVYDRLRELSIAGKRFGGLHAASGKLGTGADDNVRLELLRIIFKSVNLPEKYPIARFVLWLRGEGILHHVKEYVEQQGKLFEYELNNMYVSPVLAQAILQASPNFANSPAGVRGLLKEQFSRVNDVSLEELIETVKLALTQNDSFPCTLIVLDEVQQFIGGNSDRSYDVQLLAEECCEKFQGRLLLVGTGQTAVTGTPLLKRLADRFTIRIQLSDTDVETVTRKTVLAKKPSELKNIETALTDCSGEISRHLTGTQLAPRTEDRAVLVSDYPLLPTRRRFWEKVLRSVDTAGTAGQLRTQLKIVDEAVKISADAPLGTVVAGDYVYEQIATDLLQSGVLLNEIYNKIEQLKGEGQEGRLKARICALCYLIGKLPREEGTDAGIRATVETLADLLVKDLQRGSEELRNTLPSLLDELTSSGFLMPVEQEYRLQTRESGEWETVFRREFQKILSDAPRIDSDRDEALRKEISGRFRGKILPQGTSRTPRKLLLHFSDDDPPTDQGVPIWFRDGWKETEKGVMNDVRAAGVDSPIVFVYIPRRSADDLKQSLATFIAAENTLNVKGTPSTKEGLEARSAMQTRRNAAEEKLNLTYEEILRGARVFLAGGSEYVQSTLVESVIDAAKNALDRMYPNFEQADYRWETVLKRARNGDGSALAAIGYNGAVEQHAVCDAMLKYIGTGKKGSDIRKEFSGGRYGWPQDAIDATLILLTHTEHLRARFQGNSIQAGTLDQRKLSAAEFRVEHITLTAAQRITIRKLYQKVELNCKSGEELSLAKEFLQVLLEFAEQAGGDPPLPTRPNSRYVQDLLSLTGNEQLVKMYEEREQLAQDFEEWQRTAEKITQRDSGWERLLKLFTFAPGTMEVTEIQREKAAILEERRLLNDPDPMLPLREKVCQILRNRLTEVHQAYSGSYTTGMEDLLSSEVWQKLASDQQQLILRETGVNETPEIAVGTEDELLRSLESMPLDVWKTNNDALPQRFDTAQIRAAQLLEPKAVPVKLTNATLHTEEEVEQWLNDTRDKILEYLKEAPVIV